MREPIRVPMPTRPHVLAEDDLTASVAAMTGRYGRRFSMDVAEEALADMGRQAIPFVAQKLAEHIVHHPEHRLTIERTVSDYLNNPAWAAPIIEDEIRRTVARFMEEMLDDMYGDVKRRLLGERAHGSTETNG